MPRPAPLRAATAVLLFVLPPALAAVPAPGARGAALASAIADHVVLGELYYDSPGTDTDCFVELYNPTAAAVSLAGWRVVGLNGNGNTEYGQILLTGMIPAHGFYLIGQDGSVLGVVPDQADPFADYQNGADAVLLKDASGARVDAIGYGEDPDVHVEGLPYTDVSPGESIERKSGPVHDEARGNGWDTDSNIDDLRTRTSPEPQSSASPPETPPPPGDTNPPVFAGLESVTDAGLGGSLLLRWSPATDPEGSIPITYRVYRATTPAGEDFGAPIDSTTRADGYADNHLTNGETYYYVVRASDAFHNEEGNTVERSAAPSGVPPVITAYYGTLHAHTTFSDGVGTPTQAFAYARDVAGIDVLCLSEHTHQITDANYALLRTIADGANADGSFIAVAGQEVGLLSAFGHLNVYDGPTRVQTPSSDLDGAYAFVDSFGLAASFCHPADWNGTNFDSFRYVAAADSTLGGLAILSGDGPPYESALETALGRGWHVGTIGDQDVHVARWGDLTNPSGDILLTGFAIDELTRGAVLGAVKRRATYAFEENPPGDRIAFSLAADGAPMGSELEAGAEVQFAIRAVSPTAIARVELLRDGLVAQALELGTLAVVWDLADAPPDGLHRYRVRLTQADGDRLWSSPVWVTVAAPAVIADPGEAGAPALGLAARVAPNPFAPQIAGIAAIRFHLPAPGAATVRVVDAAGRTVRVLRAGEPLGPGWHDASWDGRDGAGRGLARGVYFIEVAAGRELAAAKLVLAR
jgi:hypothetical protein